MRQLKAFLPLTLLLSFCGFLFVACDDEGDEGGLRSTQGSLLDIEPEAILFPPLLEGESDTLSLQLFNRGQGPLLLRDFSLDLGGSPEGVFQVSLEREGELRPLEGQLEIAGGDETPLTLQVRYEPAESEVLYEATLRFRSNDRQDLVEVPIGSSDQGPVIAVTPVSLSFPAVDAGEVEEVPLLVSNLGLSDLVISALSLNGSMDFSVSFEETAISGALDEPIRLSPGQSTELTVIYAPPTAGPDEGELVLTSNDPVSPNFVVPISANGAAPCIQVLPDLLDFGGGRLVEELGGESPNVRPVVIESCGSSPLRINRIEVEDEHFGLVTMLEADEEGTLLRLAAATPGEPFPTSTLEVGFWPLLEQAYGGELRLYTNASVEPIVVELFGRGTENACPLPGVTQELLQVEPLDVITLDGGPSSDPGGEVERWVWTVLERPSGSVSQVVENLTSPLLDPAGGGDPDDEATPTARFFVDLAGRYVIELKVYDNLGQQSCAPKESVQVVIEAIPEKDIHIQLVWSTPDDPDETDNLGTDIDLHFKHENAGQAWGGSARTWDCYFDNKQPDWGVEGLLADNPSLDIDDTNGAGPENVNLDQPEVGVSYDVGAIYFRAESTFGLEGVDPRIEHPSYVTLRLFVRGELLAEFVDQELNRALQLWHVASISWCEEVERCPEFTFHNEIYEEGEYAN